jgi:hypothetical protein
MTKRTKERWFWAWLVQMTVAKNQAANPSAKCEVWENLIIVQAENERKAYNKVTTIGKGLEGDCRGTLRLNGKTATTKFLGISDMGLIHDGLEDGAEILWRLKKCRQADAHALIKQPQILLADLKNELSYLS